MLIWHTGSKQKLVKYSSFLSLPPFNAVLIPLFLHTASDHKWSVESPRKELDTNLDGGLNMTFFL